MTVFLQAFIVKKSSPKSFQQIVPDVLITQTSASALHNAKRFQTIVTD